MAYSRSAVVKQAQTWIGLKESDGSHMKIVNIYNSHKPLARGYKLKSTDSWCAATVSAVAIECGYTKIIPTEVSCPQMIELFKKLGEWQENDAYKPSEGDVIFYDWDDSGSGDNRGTSDHVGIVEKVSGNTITVIEGNKNNAVGRRTLKVNGTYIRGYGVPKYDGSSTGSSSSSGSSIKPSGSGSASGKTVNYKVKINTPSGVNMRSSAKVANDNKVYAIPNGKTVTITKESGGWGYTSYNEYKGWISLEYTKKVSSGSSSSGSSSSGSTGYKVGSTYTTQVELKVRTGAGTNYRVKKRSELTADGRKHDKDGDACLDSGTRITCQQVKKVGSDVWIKCPSGWIAAYYKGEKYVK